MINAEVIHSRKGGIADLVIGITDSRLVVGQIGVAEPVLHGPVHASHRSRALRGTCLVCVLTLRAALCVCGVCFDLLQYDEDESVESRSAPAASARQAVYRHRTDARARSLHGEYESNVFRPKGAEMAEIERLNRRVRARGDRSTKGRSDGHQACRRHLLTRSALLVLCLSVLEGRSTRKPSLGVCCCRGAWCSHDRVQQASSHDRLARSSDIRRAHRRCKGFILGTSGVGIERKASR